MDTQKPLFNISNRPNNLLDNNLKITKLIKRLKIEPKNTLLSTLYIIRFHYKYTKIYPHKLQQNNIVLCETVYQLICVFSYIHLRKCSFTILYIEILTNVD